MFFSFFLSKSILQLALKWSFSQCAERTTDLIRFNYYKFSESIEADIYEEFLYSPGLPRKTDEYKRLVASAFRASGGDDHSLRHHRPIQIRKGNTKQTLDPNINHNYRSSQFQSKEIASKQTQFRWWNYANSSYCIGGGALPNSPGDAYMWVQFQLLLFEFSPFQQRRIWCRSWFRYSTVWKDAMKKIRQKTKWE